MGINSITRLSAGVLAGVFAAAPCAFAHGAAQQPTATTAKPAQAPASEVERRRQAYEKYVLGEQFERQGDYVRAVEAYKLASDLQPGEDQPRIALARLYLANRNSDAARTVADAVLKTHPDSIGAHAVLAEIYVTEAISAGALDKTKAANAIGELEQIVKLDEKADIDLGSRSVKALSLLGQLYKSIDEDKQALDAFERLSRIGSGNSETFTTLARLYFDQRKYRDAAKAADQARKLDASNLEAMLILGQSLLRTGRAAEASETYKQVLDAAPPDAHDGLSIEYADALMQSGKYTEAIDILKPILAANPKNVRAVRILADAYRRSGRRDVAAKTLEDALVGQDVSESLELVFALAETYEELEQFDKAISTYEEALAALLNPDGTVGESDKNNASVILRRIATAHRYAGRTEKVAETYERMRKVLGPDDSTPDMLEVQDAIETAHYDPAIAQARRAASTAKADDKRTLTFLEAQALGRQGKIDDAVKLLQGMLTGASTDDDIHAFTAVVQLDAGDAVGAERSIRKALASDPDDTGLLITLSSIQDKAGRFPEAEATLRKVLELDPDNATALNNLGYFLTERTKRLDEALTLIQRAVNIDPTNGSFLDSLGWLYYQMGKMPEAKKYLEQAVSYEFQSATIREHLGDLFLKLGDAVKARQYWEAALRLSNERDEVARLKGKLKE
ncbi:MAG TPA: tetratricopeptide repeat protein [Blastocatellia bacterium]|nr:tetratricopeptide repeat protein [Blastocatellia bacterium]